MEFLLLDEWGSANANADYVGNTFAQIYLPEFRGTTSGYDGAPPNQEEPALARVVQRRHARPGAPYFKEPQTVKPEDKPAFDTPFAWIGGEDRVHALTERFYDLMDLEPAYAELRAVHGSDLASARQKLFWFLCGWLGGPQHYTERFGHPRLRMRHMPFAIGIRERDQWLACMDQAMGETGVPDDLRARLRQSFFQTADWMRNTHV